MSKYLGHVVIFMLGFACAWFMRGTSLTKHHDAQASEDSSASSKTIADSKQSNKSVASTTAKPSNTSSRQTQAPQKQDHKGRVAMVEANDMFKQVFGKADEALLETLVSELSLTPAQKEAIRKSMASRYPSLDSLDPQDMNETKLMESINKSLSRNSLDQLISSHLNEDQKAQLTTFRQKEKQASVDSRTLKSLANITSAVTLSEQQREQVYAALAKEEEAKWDKDGSAENMQSQLMEGMGMETQDDLSIHSVFSDPDIAKSMQEEVAAGNDQMGGMNSKVLELAKEKISLKIDAKVAALSGILSPEQQAQYRKSMEAKTSATMSMFDSAIKAAEKK